MTYIYSPRLFNTYNIKLRKGDIIVFPKYENLQTKPVRERLGLPVAKYQETV